jgi:predicted NAD-dependent protein-ADP-ribosyltransferase YbiA (DUF1768 family)
MRFIDLRIRQFKATTISAPIANNRVANWFSNMERTSRPIRIDDLEFFFVENAYVAAKTSDKAARGILIDLSPFKAKQMGGHFGSLPTRTDWDEVKLAAMDFLLRQKFQIGTPELERLVAEKEVIEWNLHGDANWGVPIDKRRGRNALGLLLMLIAQEAIADNYVAPGVPEPFWMQRQERLIPLLNALTMAAEAPPPAQQMSLF